MWRYINFSVSESDVLILLVLRELELVVWFGRFVYFRKVYGFLYLEYFILF